MSPTTELPVFVGTRVLSADRRGSSWPALVETSDGLRFTKLRGAGQGTGPLVAEIVVAVLAEALGLHVPARSLVVFEGRIESMDRDGELRHLLDASEGVNLGFAYLEGARMLSPNELERVNADDAAAIVWLDRLVLNPDRTHRNPNLMWWRDRLWLIDHGAALGFQYAWSSVSESSTSRPLMTFEPHVLRERVSDLQGWDEIFAARLTRDVIEDAVAQVPDSFLTPLLALGDAENPESLRRRRAAYSAFLWKRLKAPRDWVSADTLAEPRPRRGAPSWLDSDRRR
ncbi:MAG TPA: HipA family kinase [Gemmatimonadaceae bacterium]